METKGIPGNHVIVIEMTQEGFVTHIQPEFDKRIDEEHFATLSEHIEGICEILNETFNRMLEELAQLREAEELKKGKGKVIDFRGRN